MAKQILIIDDDRGLSDEISEIFVDEGFMVESAYDGLQGGQLIRNFKYDVILLDLKMPALNGIEVLRIARQHAPASKVFLLSGRPAIEKLLEDEGLMDSVCCFMNKPFDIAALLEKIKSI
jgi:two-component system, OmpR family, response regulator QseB